MKSSTRNMIIFALVSLTCGFVGQALNSLYGPADPMQSLGVLIWLVSPLLANLLLRALGGDGWRDFGLGLKLKSGWPWYMAALLFPLMLSLLPLLISALAGTASLGSLFAGGWGAFLTLLAANFTGSMLKNIFEEFAWRGYLAPRLETTSAGSLLKVLITGWVWAGWHIPYYLYFLSPDVLRSQTALGVPALIALAFLILPCQAFLYNEVRLISGSVWPAWLMHTAANTLSFVLVTGSGMQPSKAFTHLLLTPGTEGLLYSLLAGLLGWWLHRRRLAAHPH